jgi:hypothetical protein
LTVEKIEETWEWFTRYLRFENESGEATPGWKRARNATVDDLDIPASGRRSVGSLRYDPDMRELVDTETGEVLIPSSDTRKEAPPEAAPCPETGDHSPTGHMIRTREQADSALFSAVEETGREVDDGCRLERPWESVPVEESLLRLTARHGLSHKMNLGATKGQPVTASCIGDLVSSFFTSFPPSTSVRKHIVRGTKVTSSPEEQMPRTPARTRTFSGVAGKTTGRGPPTEDFVR